MSLIVRKTLAIVLAFSMTVTLLSCSAAKSSAKPQISSSPKIAEVLKHETLEKEGLSYEDLVIEGLQIEPLIAEKLMQESGITEVQSVSVRAAVSSSDYYDENDFYGYEYVDSGSIANKLAIGGGVLFIRVILQKAGMLKPIKCLLMTTTTGTIVSGVGGAFAGASATVDSSGRLFLTMSIITAIVDAIIATVFSAAAISTGGITMLFGALSLSLTYANDIITIATSVEKLTKTPNQDIDWNNVNWDNLGYTTAKEAAESTADGFMFAALTGVISK